MCVYTHCTVCIRIFIRRSILGFICILCVCNAKSYLYLALFMT